ncbi:hypothetical protein C2I33_08135 [Ralstonia solanacearum]|nr:hypothetical protein C2I33_08135 [Ralstonia solanacearum]
MLSGVSLSCYQACETAGRPIAVRIPGPSNFPNLNSLTFSRSAPFRWTTAKRQDTRHFVRRRKPGFPARRAAP